jgi:hypothetical protein
MYASSIPETAASRLMLRKDQMLKLRYDSTKTSMVENFPERRSLPVAANLDKSGSVLNVLGHTLIVPLIQGHSFPVFGDVKGPFEF